MSPALKEETIFMDLSALLNVFDTIFKCSECNSDMSYHVDMNKKNGFSHYIVLQCKSTECNWKYYFNTSKKQGHSYEVNVRAALALRGIGRGHTAMTTFSKVMNMPTPPTRKNFMKIQNRKIPPVVKQLASDSMVSNAMSVRQQNANDGGECGVSIDDTWQKRVMRRTMVW